MKNLLLIIAAAIALSLSARPARKAAGPSEADRAKADYIYLEALRTLGNDDRAAGFELLRRAHELNPADPEIGLELALPYLQLSGGDDSLVAKGMGLLRNYRAHNPADYYSGVQYALLSARTGDLPEALRTWGLLHRLNPTNEAVMARYADALGQSGATDSVAKAIGIYDSIEAVNGPDMQLTAQKLKFYYAQNDTAAIFNEMSRLREAVPGNVENIIMTADLCMMFGKQDEALGYYNEAIATDSTNGHAVYARANYFKETGDTVSYGREVMRALRMEKLELPDKLSILHGYVSTVYNDSTLQPTLRNLFEELVVMHPGEAEIHNLYGRFLASTKDVRGAAEQFEIGLGLEPDDAEAWDLLVRLYFMDDDYPKVEKAVGNAIHYFPDNAEFHSMQAMLYALTDRREQALAAIDTAITLTAPTETIKLSELYTQKGDNFYALERPDSAFVYYEKAILYNPDNFLALNNAAYHLAESNGDLDKALEWIEKVIENTPEQTTALDTYAWVLFKRKDYAKAREIIDRVMELDAEQEGEVSEEVLHHAGDIHFMDGDPAGALKFWREALELAPDNDLLKRKVKNKSYYYE